MLSPRCFQSLCGLLWACVFVYACMNRGIVCTRSPKDTTQHVNISVLVFIFCSFFTILLLICEIIPCVSHQLMHTLHGTCNHNSIYFLVRHLRNDNHSSTWLTLQACPGFVTLGIWLLIYIILCILGYNMSIYMDSLDEIKYLQNTLYFALGG